jgi:predicted nuclease with TOPRIM domain
VVKLDEAKIFEMLGKLDERTIQILEQTKRTNGRVTRLEDRVDELESNGDTAAGAKAVRKSFWNHFWDVGKIAIGALVGLLVGGLKK